jgi:hypothetical protein
VKRILPSLALLLAPLCALAAPQQVTATYNMAKGKVPIGIVTETFSRSGSTYRIESETKATGVMALFAKDSIRLLSTGEIDRKGLKPLHFEHHRGVDPAKRITADFDWKTSQLTMQHDGQSEAVKLEPGTQDRISLMYQFMYLPPKAKELSLYMTNGRTVERYVYRLVGEEKIKTGIGELKTRHYSKVHQPDEGGAEVWLAPAYSNFPVRIVVTEKDGDKLEQTLSRLETK